MKKINQRIKILGIETSCDETSAAVVAGKLKIENWKLEILSNVISSQIDLHRKYGGVYPELASRAHLEYILPAISTALDQANIKINEIDAIAVCVGPGLIGSLLVGVETARTLAWVLKKTLIGINHLEGHIAANFIYGNPKSKITNSKKIEFPILNLVVSGGHTCLVLMQKFGKYQIIGQTRDDAAGEAFHKVAQLIGLSYPGGPAIEACASTILNSKHVLINQDPDYLLNFSKRRIGKIQNKFQIQRSKPQEQQTTKYKLQTIRLPRPMIDSEDFDFSFSGLKTAVLKLTKELGPTKIKKYQAQIATEFQNAVCDVLVAKTIAAAKKYQVHTIALAGGVAANKQLRKTMAAKIKKFIPNSLFLIPDLQLCTDNAAMIATAGLFHYLKKDFSNPLKFQANSNQKLS